MKAEVNGGEGWQGNGMKFGKTWRGGRMGRRRES